MENAPRYTQPTDIMFVFVTNDDRVLARLTDGRVMDVTGRRDLLARKTASRPAATHLAPRATHARLAA